MGISVNPGRHADFGGDHGCASRRAHHSRGREGFAMNIELKMQGTPSVSRSLAGKISLVTGSTSGIGLGIARALAEAGSDVVLNGLGVASEVARAKDRILAGCDVEVRYSPGVTAKTAGSRG